MKKIKKIAFAVLFLLAGTFLSFEKKEARAAIIEVTPENNASKEITINLEDYIVFRSDDATYTYTYYCNENGTNLFSFGNGKYWAAQPGTATVIISGRDREGRDSFIADYRIRISDVKSVPKIVEETVGNTESPTPPSSSEGNSNTENTGTLPEQVDMQTVSIDEKELTDHRVVIRSRDKRYSNFALNVNSPVPLTQNKNAKISFKNSNKNFVYVVNLKTKLYIGVEGIGKDTLTVTVNDKDFVFDVNITEESLSETTIVLTSGDSYELKLNGVSNSPVFWESEDESVAVIDNEGRITALSEGHSVITVTTAERTFAAVVSVTSDIKKKVANYTRSYSSKNRYSQPKRMLEGFYDCSSLVWRAYHKYGHDIILTNYAPVAAAMGLYYTNTKKLIEGGVSKENIENMVFEPGDLLFVEGKKNNRRYKNINHVEMIYGYSIEGFDADNRPILGIRYANNHQVDFKGFVGRPNTDESEISTNRY